MEKYNKQVSIIIVSYNTRDLTTKCIKSIFEKTKEIDFEIIVVDNGSKDGSLQELRNIFQDKIKIIEAKENLGFGRANNLGIKQSQGKYIFLLNPDTELINNAIKIFYDYMEQNKQVGVCGGNLYNIHNDPATSFCMYHNTITSYLYWRFVQICSKLFSAFNGKKFYCNFNYSNKIKEVGYITGADMFIRKSALDKSGLFDESIFMYGEDIDLNFRIRNDGYFIKSIPQAKIYHIENASFKVDNDENILKNYKIRKHSDYKFYFKTFGKLTYLIYLETQISNIIRILVNILLPKSMLKKIYLVVKSTNVYKQMYKIDREEYTNYSSKLKEKRVLIFADARLGDFIWATSAISLIKNYDKNINITLITSKSYISLVDNNFVDNIIVTNPKYHESKNSFCRMIYKFYWLFINYFKLANNDTILFLDVSKFVAFSAKKILRIKNIVGPTILWYRYNTSNPDTKYYTHQINLPKDQDRMHMMIRYQTLVRNIFPTYNLSIPTLKKVCLDSKKINQLITNKKYKIAICTKGSLRWKSWNLNYLKTLILKVNDVYDVSFYVLGNSKDEIDTGNILKKELSNIDIINTCGKTSIIELQQLLQKMDLLISVDTGTIHLASIYKVPSIVLNGSSLPEQTRAVNPKTVTLCSYRDCAPCHGCLDPKCLQDITPEMVLEEVKKILK